MFIEYIICDVYLYQKNISTFYIYKSNQNDSNLHTDHIYAKAILI